MSLKSLILNLKSNRGMTLIEALTAIALIVVILIPVYGLYNLSQK
ncbi:unnamed protein product, partial [marine sediment metagenome]